MEFTTFLTEQQVPLLRIARAMAGNREQAEDLVAEVLESMYPRWSVIDDPHRYARRAIVYQYRKTLRRAAIVRFVPFSTPKDSPSAATHDDDVALRIDLDRALQRLSADQRAVLVLRFLEDHTAESIATVLEKPAGTVRRLTHDGLRNLRQLLGNGTPVSAEGE